MGPMAAPPAAPGDPIIRKFSWINRVWTGAIKATGFMGGISAPLALWEVYQHHWLYGRYISTTGFMGGISAPLALWEVYQHHWLYGGISAPLALWEVYQHHWLAVCSYLNCQNKAGFWRLFGSSSLLALLKAKIGWFIPWRIVFLIFFFVLHSASIYEKNILYVHVAFFAMQRVNKLSWTSCFCVFVVVVLLLLLLLFKTGII